MQVLSTMLTRPHALASCSGFKPLNLLGTTKHCLNLGSYNYLGFAAADEYCTPRVQATLKELGNSTCSPRADVGENENCCSTLYLTLCILRSPLHVFFAGRVLPSP